MLGTRSTPIVDLAACSSASWLLERRRTCGTPGTATTGARRSARSSPWACRRPRPSQSPAGGGPR
eukprot:12004499-Alexandrium_andersonii.AAC.1